MSSRAPSAASQPNTISRHRKTSGSIDAFAISRKAGSANSPHSTALTAKPPQGNLSPAAAFIFVYDRRPISQQLALRPRHLVLIVATKDYARTSQQRGRDQHANHDRRQPHKTPACPRRARPWDQGSQASTRRRQRQYLEHSQDHFLQEKDLISQEPVCPASIRPAYRHGKGSVNSRRT